MLKLYKASWENGYKFELLVKIQIYFFPVSQNLQIKIEYFLRKHILGQLIAEIFF